MIYIKTVGIIIRSFSENDKKFLGSREDLFKSLYRYHINIIGIPINNNFENIKNIIDRCDGVILSGGDSPILNDYLVVDYLYKKNIPTLGICLGMQIMGSYFSQESLIEVENHLSHEEYVHYIRIKKNSILNKIINQDKILVNSRHKQALKNTKLDVVAMSEDFVIEAIEDASKKFFLGVEWHPESLNDSNSLNLFDYFISML